MSPAAKIAQFRELLSTSSEQALRSAAAELFALGVHYDTLAPLVWQHVADKSVSDYSWLPAASCVNHADSYWLVDLQQQQHKHQMMTFGEAEPEFCRVELPPPLPGSLPDLKLRLSECAGLPRLVADRALSAGYCSSE